MVLIHIIKWYKNFRCDWQTSILALHSGIFQMPFLLTLGEFYQSGEEMCQKIFPKKAFESNKKRIILRKEVLTALFHVKTKVIMGNPGHLTEKKDVSSGNQHPPETDSRNQMDREWSIPGNWCLEHSKPSSRYINRVLIHSQPNIFLWRTRIFCC